MELIARADRDMLIVKISSTELANLVGISSSEDCQIKQFMQSTGNKIDISNLYYQAKGILSSFDECGRNVKETAKAIEKLKDALDKSREDKKGVCK